MLLNSTKLNGLALVALLSLLACGGGHSSPGDAPGSNIATPAGGGNEGNDGGDGENPPPPPQSAACNDPAEARMPATPTAGNSRAGLACAINIPIPSDSEIPGQPAGIIGFQVLEPTLLEGGERYPLILEGHGFSGSRQRAPNQTGTAGLVVPNGPILDAGYGVISIDQAGHGETGGLIRLMDPGPRRQNADCHLRLG